MSTPTTTGQFFARLYPPALGLAGFISLLDGKSKMSVHVPALNIELAEKYANEINEQGNCYFGVGLRNLSIAHSGKLDSDGTLVCKERGKREDVICIPGYWSDIDLCIPPVHADPTKYPSLDAAIEIIDLFPHKPTDVIFTGYGLHCYWLFEKPLYFTSTESYAVHLSSKAFQVHFNKLWKDRGFKLDQTGDITRVLRPIGTHNQKTNEKKEVVYLICDDHRYKPEQLNFSSSVATQLDKLPSGTVPKKLKSNDKIKHILAKLAKSVDTRELFTKIAAGESFALEGSRDTLLQRAASAIAAIDTETDPRVLAEILRPSLDAMSREVTNESNPAPDFENAVDKILRSQQDIAPKKAAREAERKERDNEFHRVLFKQSSYLGSQSSPPPVDRSSDSSVSASTESERAGPGGGPTLGIALEPPRLAPEPLKALGRDPDTYDPPNASSGGAPAFGEASPPVVSLKLSEMLREEHGSKVFGYTETQMQQFMTLHGYETLEEFRLHTVIQSKNRYFFMVNGEYQKPIYEEELEVSLFRDLAGWGNRIEWEVETKTGFRKKKAKEILHGTSDTPGMCQVARTISLDMTIESSRYDRTTQCFHQAVCKKRDLRPLFDPKVDVWLRLLGGKYSDKLLDWLATSTSLDRQTCALYLSGCSGAGKTMLLIGLSRIYTEGGPTELDRIITNFNADLLRCPIILADEFIPQGKKVSADLRRIIATNVRSLAEKFVTNSYLHGAVRVGLCSNNDTLIQFDDEDMTADDKVALAGRFLHIRVDESAKEYIRSIGGRAGTEGWVEGDIIARHVLWLTQNRTVISGERFLVEGFSSEMHEHLAVSNRNPSLVCEWIVRHIQQPSKIGTSKRYVRIGQGKILINPSAMLGGAQGGWAPYMEHEKWALSVRKITQALQGLSHGKETVSVDGSEEVYFSVDPKHVYTWSEVNAVGSPELLKRWIDGPQIIEEVEIKPSGEPAQVINFPLSKLFAEDEHKKNMDK